MRDEISAAVLFLTRLVSRSGSHLDSRRLAEFGARLSTLLVERFDGHWFPDHPFRGQGYRCIRLNEYGKQPDPLLERAARDCGLTYEDLRLPVELTVWVDPEEVCCRFGEHKGSYCTIASFGVTAKDPSDLQSVTIQASLPTSTFRTTMDEIGVEPAQQKGQQQHLQQQHCSLSQDHPHQLGIVSANLQRGHCYLVPHHQTIKPHAFGGLETCASGRMFDHLDQNSRRMDYTVFPFVANSMSSFDSTPPVSYSLQDDCEGWMDGYPLLQT